MSTSRRIFSFNLSAILAASLFAVSSMALTPNSISYQGRATDASGVPLNGVQNMNFTIYDAETLGTVLWTSGDVGIICDSGFFAVELGAGAMFPFPSTLFDDSTRYLEVAINTQAQSPRTRIISSAFARRVAGLQGAVGGTVSGNINLQIAGNTTVELQANGSRISTYSTSGLERARLWGTSWGELLLYPISLGTATATLTSTPPALLLTNSLGTPTISLFGNTTGDGSVVLPGGSISSGEIANEPGTAAIYDATAALTGTASNITLRTITLPDDGYVIAMATGTSEIAHNTGSFSLTEVSISTTSATMNANNTVQHQVSGNAPSGDYRSPISVTAVFDVPAGANTFYFVGLESGGAISTNITKSRLVLLYVPTAYGTITTFPAIVDQDERAEQSEAEQFNTNRLARELEKLQQQMTELQAQVKAAQASAGNDAQQ